jgi:NAD(P)H-dependent flavin oxidoreductase YrpB (nitropropane dioxygenase family)
VYTSGVIATDFTRLVGCRAPIQLAPMPFIATPELAAAVSNAGGLGMVGTAMIPPDALARLLESVRAATDAPFGAGFLIPFADRACVEVAASRARVIDFFYGEPDPGLVALAHRSGALAGWQVGSCAEARAAARAGCDFVVAQGYEAGGHVRGRTSTLPLLAEVADAVGCPVVAAGGVATPRALAAALAAGAGAVRMGTRFVASAESGAHPRYVELLLRADAGDTVYTTDFGVMWPDAPHRVLRCALEAAHALEASVAGKLDTPGGPFEIPRFSLIAPDRSTTGAIDAMALYAGESVGSVRAVQPAGEIVRELVDGAAALLARAGGAR